MILSQHFFVNLHTTNFLPLAITYISSQQKFIMLHLTRKTFLTLHPLKVHTGFFNKG